MRYRLRTLLIVVALMSVVFARVAYFKRMAQLHRQKAEVLVAQVSAYRQNPGDYVTTLIDDDASAGKAYKFRRNSRSIGPMKITVSVRKGLPRKDIWLDEASCDAWETAVAHKVLAARYERAAYRPWTRVSEQLTE